MIMQLKCLLLLLHVILCKKLYEKPKIFTCAKKPREISKILEYSKKNK